MNAAPVSLGNSRSPRVQGSAQGGGGVRRPLCQCARPRPGVCGGVSGLRPRQQRYSGGQGRTGAGARCRAGVIRGPCGGGGGGRLGAFCISLQQQVPGIRRPCTFVRALESLAVKVLATQGIGGQGHGVLGPLALLPLQELCGGTRCFGANRRGLRRLVRDGSLSLLEDLDLVSQFGRFLELHLGGAALHLLLQIPDLKAQIGFRSLS
mmetsp:Transcript_84740/g.141278  ORF Transcript_84740/g.141278 Transcript_84740/m.141278 type:complete len:208 (+) Transcript_84740:657-1280(+)